MSLNRYVWAVALVVLSSCQNQTISSEDKKLSLIIDADTANEVDDLYAIVRAVAEPRFNLIGITSAQFHISPLASDSSVWESQRINEEILHLLDRKDIPTPLGSNDTLSNFNIPASSPASRFIIDQAHKMKEGEKLNIAVLGPCTNVASAILEDPSIIHKISVHYIGFWHDPAKNTYNKAEFNSGNDMNAVNLLLNTSNLDFNVMSATTCQYLVFDKEDTFEKLKNMGPLGQYLMDRWENYDRWWTKDDPMKKKWIMWDVAIIEALADQTLAKAEPFATPQENTPRTIDIYTTIEVEQMKEDFWSKVSSLIP